MSNLTQEDVRKFKKMRIRMDHTCDNCLRKNCNCLIIHAMKKRGWSVTFDDATSGYRIDAPEGRYNVIYAQKELAWNFAVRRFLGEKR